MKEESNNNSILIPDWFDLKKYDMGKELPLLDWTLNLLVRRDIRQSAGCQRSECKDEMMGYARDDFDLIKEHGFLDRTHTEFEYEDAKRDYNLRELKPGFGLVYPLPLNRAVEVYESIRSDTELRNKLAMVDYQEIFHDQRTEPLHGGEAWLKRWYEEVYEAANYDESCCGDYAGFSPHICVDLGAPDETIIDAFKDWLKAARKEGEPFGGANLPEKVSTKLIERWANSAVLPFLDLLIYQELEQISLPMHVIGNAIFPITADFDTTEAVRKTTRPNAYKALQQVYVIMRHAFIVEELQKSGKKNR